MDLLVDDRATKVNKVSRLASVMLYEITSCQGRASTIRHDANIASEVAIVDVPHVRNSL